MPEIGATLREARMRARIDVSEIEATTKIRAKYLRALENEEWSLLPGPTFVKSFLRTYAQALGLDGKALVEEYRVSEEHPGDGLLEPIVSTPGRRSRGASGGGSGPSRAYVATVSVIGAVIVLLIVLLVSSGGGGGSGTTHAASTRSARTHKHPRGAHARGTTTAHRTAAPGGIVSLSLRATALVYVCLLGDGGRVLIPGSELAAGESTATFHARRFEITLGNSAVDMTIDGTPRTVAPSSQAIGYSITKALGRQPLPAGQLPTCT